MRKKLSCVRERFDNFRTGNLSSDQETALNKLFMKVQVALVEDVGQSAFKSWLHL